MSHRKINQPNHQLHKLSHPQHAILGLMIIAVSTVLICNDFYYFWPPFMAGFLNDDAIGALGLVLGINLLVWSIRNKNNVRVNFWQLVLSCGFWIFEASAEFIHGYVAGKSHMITAGLLEFGMFLFTLSIIGKSEKKQR